MLYKGEKYVNLRFEETIKFELISKYKGNNFIN